ncbi:hypothetical protein DLAC_02055 [Tieghemostelium lacteum]|uniref:RNA methyltransferase n=1 Tax=Tieghemostelium lacteum TaxID=361077 RepID=A0A152A5F7_TIELA|nr:hypothetical protein DLAC_02055 [Tieghemostelium lacteum]|eukprot:KYR01331.1 hypothetical protein DLAC_02055 [Tieghemostelium lacteum]
MKRKDNPTDVSELENLKEKDKDDQPQEKKYKSQEFSDETLKLIKKDHNSQSIYGNYHGYYNYRNDSDDSRFKILIKSLFYQKKCLDIGCNSGDVTFKIVKDYEPISMIGVDIDQHLIQKANYKLNSIKNEFKSKPSTVMVDNSESSNVQVSNGLKYSRPIDKYYFIPLSFRIITSHQNQYPYNISFICQNFLYENVIIDHKNSYDVIMALSISKWIHLNWGDEGIKKFFFKIYNLLKVGGIFIFEPQDFKGYKKRLKMSEIFQSNYKDIKLKPNEFQDFLLNQVHFKSVEILFDPKSTVKTLQPPTNNSGTKGDTPTNDIEMLSTETSTQQQTTTTTTTTSESNIENNNNKNIKKSFEGFNRYIYKFTK